MKKYIYISMIIIGGFFTATCDEYDDSGIRNDIANLESRVTALEDYCSSLNIQISDIQSTVEAIESSVYVTSVTTVTDGHLISFSNGTSFTICNGADGEDGSVGSTPVIGVTLIDGVYYWTMNGTLITDSEGNYIRASAQDGSVGTTPQLKIDNGYWYVSYDGGNTWELLGIVTDDTVQYITSVNYDNNYVYITLYDGTVLTLQMKVNLNVSFNLPEVGITLGGESIEVVYTITGGDENTTISLVTRDGYTAKVDASDSTSGTITITSPVDYVSSSVSVYVVSDAATVMRIITLKASGVITVTDDAVTVSFDASQVLIPVTTNLEYEVSIPDDADWLSYTSTRAELRDETVVLDIEENTSMNERYTTISLIAVNDTSVTQTVLITQSGHDIELNSNWSVEYFGKYYSGGTYYDRIDYVDGDGGSYGYGVYSSKFIESYSIEELAERLQTYIDEIDSTYYDGYYVANLCSAANVEDLHTDLAEDSSYYALMFGVNDDGDLTGYYQISPEFTIDSVGSGSSAYNAWLGTWNFTDSATSAYTGTFTIWEHEADESYYMYLNTADTWLIDVTFDSSDGSIAVLTTDAGDYVAGSSDKRMHWIAWYSSSTSARITELGLEICDGVMEGTTATLTGKTMTTSSNVSYTPYAMKFAIYNGLSYSLDFSYRTNLVLPVTLEYSSAL